MTKLFKVVAVLMVALVSVTGVALFLAEKSLADETKDFGNYGRFVVSGTTIDVPVYYFYMYDADFNAVQSVVDDPNKAVAQDFSGYWGYQVAMNIADHKNHGFDQLYDVIPGETTCEIQHEDGTVTRYLCESVDHNGTNSEEDGIVNSAGVIQEVAIPSDWLWTYTCNPEGWWTVTVVCWSPITE